MCVYVCNVYVFGHVQHVGVLEREGERETGRDYEKERGGGMGR